MSQAVELARRVKVHVAIDGHDATSWLEPYLLDFSFTDNAHGKADEVQITLHDREGKWSNEWKPKKGMEVTATIVCGDWFKRGDSISLPCGAFRIDEIEFSGPPDKIRIKAVTSALTTGLRDTHKTRAWENASLKVVAGQIAEEHDLELMYDADDAHDFERRDQRNESDLAFNARMAEEHGLLCKAHDGKLILVDAKKAETAPAALAISRTGGDVPVKSYTFKQASSKTAYSGAHVEYTDPAEGRTHTAEVRAADAGEQDEKMLELNRGVESVMDAVKAAGSTLDAANSQENTATMEIMGHPGAVALVTVDLTGFGDFSGRYIVKKAEHKVGGSGGYATSLELSKCRLKPDVVVKAGSAEIAARPASARINVNSGVNPVEKWENEFRLFKDFWLLSGVDDLTKLLFCLPDIADAMATRQPSAADAQGWLYLRSMFHHWFSGRTLTAGESNDPFRVDWDWVMSYARARNMYRTFTRFEDDPHGADIGTPGIVNGPALNKLGEILCRDGYMCDGPTDFDFIAAHWTEWEKAYHTLVPVPGLPFDDGLSTALGAFTFRALAAGYTEPDGKGGHSVHVTQIAVFVHDVFNFDEEGGLGINALGAWSCEGLSYIGTGGDGHTGLENADFRNFRNKYGRGGDFLVLSLPHIVENFSGVRYEYTCSL
ncbi:MAG: DUF6402 family protein [Desulfovibrio sp.]|jgi:phage protein D|nr:DUF6402 family protein [Desulfovibrio sp.]